MAYMLRLRWRFGVSGSVSARRCMRRRHPARVAGQGLRQIGEGDFLGNQRIEARVGEVVEGFAHPPRIGPSRAAGGGNLPHLARHEVEPPHVEVFAQWHRHGRVPYQLSSTRGPRRTRERQGFSQALLARARVEGHVGPRPRGGSGWAEGGAEMPGERGALSTGRSP